MKKSRLLALFLVLALVLTAFAGCGGDNGGNGDGEKTYTIGTDTTFAPFEFEDEAGNFVGIDMELLDAIAQDQGFKYELEILGFDAACQALEAGQVDGVIAGMSIKPDREEKYDFSEPYFDSGVVMGIAADNDTIKSYEDLKGKTVAVKIGTEGEAFAESIADQYGFEMTHLQDSAFMYEDVKSGNSVACFEDYPVLGYGVSQNNGLKIVTEMERGSSYGFAVLKGENPELIEMFNAGLKNLRDSGKYQEILDKYIVTEVAGDDGAEDGAEDGADAE